MSEISWSLIWEANGQAAERQKLRDRLHSTRTDAIASQLQNGHGRREIRQAWQAATSNVFSLFFVFLNTEYKKCSFLIFVFLLPPDKRQQVNVNNYLINKYFFTIAKIVGIGLQTLSENPNHLSKRV